MNKRQTMLNALQRDLSDEDYERLTIWCNEHTDEDVERQSALLKYYSMVLRHENCIDT